MMYPPTFIRATSLRARSVRFAAMAACSLLAFPPSTFSADYIIATDDLSEREFALFSEATGIAGSVRSTPYYISPTTGPRTINGTPIRFTGLLAGNVARFSIAGDLNLGPGDTVILLGHQLVQLSVANNANIHPGALITAQAFGQIAGAGGGFGGAGAFAPTAAATMSPPVVYPDRVANPDQPGVAGVAGGNVAPTANYDYIFPRGGTTGTFGLGSTGASLGVPYTRPFTPPVRPLALGGAGGAGGAPGNVRSVGDGHEGGNGRAGGDGYEGFSGFSGSSASSSIDPATALFGGGAGGAGGQYGGQGFAGATGGQGGQGGGGAGRNDLFFGYVVGGSGGQGGVGGVGGLGGLGGNGGNGAPGGGGIEILVRGRLVQSGTIRTNGETGSEGSAGGLGAEPTPAGFGRDGDRVLFGSNGGFSGAGGAGGKGGEGGKGGGGGGGSGGAISISATHYTSAATTVYDTRGGLGIEPGRSEEFRRAASGPQFIHGFNAAFSDTNRPARTLMSGANPYRSWNTAPVTKTAAYNGPSGQTPLLLDLVGGPAVYGVLAEPDGKPTLRGATQAGLAPRLSNTVAVIARRPAVDNAFRDDQYVGYDLMTFVSTADRPLANPGLSAYDLSDQNQPVHESLLEGGILNNPEFTAGAKGAAPIGSLAARQTWGTLIENKKDGADKTYSIKVSVNLYGRPREFTAELSPGGSFNVPDTGLLRIARSTDSAVVATLDAEVRALGDRRTVRAGVRTIETLQVSNVGSAVSAMSGEILVFDSAPTTFTRLPNSGNAINRTLWDTTLARGTSIERGTRINTDAASVFVSISSEAVGPVFGLGSGTSNPDGTFAIDVGTVIAGDSIRSAVNVFNLDTVGPRLPAELQNLTLLTVLGVSASGSDSFRVLNDATGFYGSGELKSLGFEFAPNAAGVFSTTLAIQTDVNAIVNTAGDVYYLTITGTAVPEPTCLSIAAIGTWMMASRRRRAHLDATVS